MNVLILYNQTQTYTNTVYEHLNSFSKYSQHKFFYCHADSISKLNINTSIFDAIGIHYTIRLPFNQISPSLEGVLKKFYGLKFLFIQDEYDFPQRVWDWINNLGIQLVFTVVPNSGIEKIYPKNKFLNTKFVSNLTGYVPEGLSVDLRFPGPSTRKLIVGYRGRPLPIRYGKLGFEKVSVGKIVKNYCKKNQIRHDIEWSEESRIYGPNWYEFMLKCRAMLGSESGSNVFDWDGSLDVSINEFISLHPNAGDEQIYNQVIKEREIDGLMNQISPKVFEAISFNTILVLFEGAYSGVLEPWKHFIPLKKDGSNLEEVFAKLSDDQFIDSMAQNAYDHVIASGKYSYKSFVEFVDQQLSSESLKFKNESNLIRVTPLDSSEHPSSLTVSPFRANPPSSFIDRLKALRWYERYSISLAYRMWLIIPESTKNKLKPHIHAMTKN
jgi:hypothetical protein